MRHGLKSKQALLKWMNEKVIQTSIFQLALLLLISLCLLAACTKTVEQTPASEEANTENEELKEAILLQVTAATPVQCEGIILRAEAIIDGNQLAPCMKEAMVAAKTGSHIVQSTSGGTHTAVDFKWDPDFAMYVENEQISLVLYEDTGWMQMPDGRWIEETDDAIDQTSNTIKLTRALAHPYMITQYLALNSTWKVIGELKVPVDEAFADVAWKLVPEEPINVENMTISNVELWLTNEYLGAYYVATARIMDVADTTSSTFTQWGGPVTIPEPDGH